MKNSISFRLTFCFLFFFSLFSSCSQEEMLEPALQEEKVEEFSMINEGEILHFSSYESFNKQIFDLNEHAEETRSKLIGFKSLESKISELSQQFMYSQDTGPEFEDFYTIKKDAEGKTFLDLHYIFFSQSLFLNEDKMVKIGDEYTLFTNSHVFYTKSENYRKLLRYCIQIQIIFYKKCLN